MWMKANGGTEGGRSQDGARNPVDRGGDRRGGDPGRTKETKKLGDTRGPRGRAAKVEPVVSED